VNTEFWYLPSSYTRSSDANVDDIFTRSAQSEDVEALSSLMTALGYPTSSEDMNRRFQAISADVSYGIQVAERRGRVLGMVASTWSTSTNRTAAAFGSWP
jgi:hypothetical protein